MEQTYECPWCQALHDGPPVKCDYCRLLGHASDLRADRAAHRLLIYHARIAAILHGELCLEDRPLPWGRLRRRHIEGMLTDHP